MDDEEVDPGEDNGDKEPSLGWTVDGCVSVDFVLDGEQGADLSVAELDALRAKRRAGRDALPPPEPDSVQFVLVPPGRGGRSNVRPLTPVEQARYLAGIKR